MELCTHCDLEWDMPVSFDEIPTVEKNINADILILDMEHIPALQTTSSIYNSLLCNNDAVKSNQQVWLLHHTDQ